MRYVQLRGQLDAPPAFNLALLSGRSLAIKCEKCDYNESTFGRTKGTKKHGHLVRICKKCSAHWPSEAADVSKGSIQVNRRVIWESDRRQGEAAFLGKVITEPPIGVCEVWWRQRLSIWTAYVIDGLSHREIGELFAPVLSAQGRGMSREAVRRLIGEVRGIVGARI